jgi:hypothetical protein
MEAVQGSKECPCTVHLPHPLFYSASPAVFEPHFSIQRMAVRAVLLLPPVLEFLKWVGVLCRRRLKSRTPKPYKLQTAMCIPSGCARNATASLAQPLPHRALSGNVSFTFSTVCATATRPTQHDAAARSSSAVAKGRSRHRPPPRLPAQPRCSGLNGFCVIACQW